MQAYTKFITAAVGLAITWLAGHGLDLSGSEAAITSAVTSVLAAGAVFFFPNKGA